MWDYLKKSNKHILLYGMGNGADKVIDELNRQQISVSGIFASPNFVRHQRFRGFEVVSYKEAKKTFKNMIVLLCFGTHLSDVIDYIKKIDNEQELFCPDVPVIGHTLFTREYYKKHQSELTNVYNMLSDDISKLVFSNIIEYKLTGDIKYLFNCETSKDEAYDNILKLTDRETYIDLGAYRGDTVFEFLLYAPKYKNIIAVEPDTKSFNHLINNTKHLNNCTCLNLAVNDKDEDIKFNMFGGRNSMVSDTGICIDACSVDSILNGKEATFIKMDVEGQEKKAIIGAESTIKKYKPKMLISSYHRTEDIFDIPNTVFSVRKDYKLYMRHFPAIPAWDTVFFFV